MKPTVLLIGLALAACSRGQVQTTATGTPIAPAGRLPAPTSVVVTDFAITPDQVKLDTGVGAMLRRQANGTTTDQATTAAAQEAQQAITETLANKLASYGLPVQRLPASTTPPPGALLVQGQIVSVDQGNRTRRMAIGFGAGQSRVTADAQLYYLADPSHPQFVQSFQGAADSGHMPGAAATMGAGAAMQGVSMAAHAAHEKYRSTEGAEATQIANALAQQIGAYAVQQGWIPATALNR